VSVWVQEELSEEAMSKDRTMLSSAHELAKGINYICQLGVTAPELPVDCTMHYPQQATARHRPECSVT
jgi:hypothetical protein